MNCDQVFDVLTRGPFPSGQRDDLRVEMHLRRCASCRRLALALQPALELFEEAVGAEESRGLPTYWGKAFVRGRSGERTKGVCVSTRSEDRARRPTARARSPWPWLNLGRFAAAVVIGASVGFALHTATELEPRSKVSVPESGEIRSAGGKPAATFLLASLGMAEACRATVVPPELFTPRDEGSGQTPPQMLDNPGENPQRASPAMVQTAHQQCCTQCHRADQNPSRGAEAVAKIGASCQYCHTR